MANYLIGHRLPEDVVEYMLIPHCAKADYDISFLEDLRDTYMTFVAPMVIDYIWQNEDFSLCPVAGSRKRLK